MSVEKTLEVVNHPPHYQTTPFQCSEAIDVIKGFKLGFHEGNAIWYLERLLPDS